MHHTRRTRWRLVLPPLLLFVLACGSAGSMFGTTSREAALCPTTPHPIPVSTVAFRETARLAPYTLELRAGFGSSMAHPPPAGYELALIFLDWHNPAAPPPTATPVASPTPATTPVPPLPSPTGAVSVTYQHALAITRMDPTPSAPTWPTVNTATWTVTTESIALYQTIRPAWTLPTTLPVGTTRHIVPILVPAQHDIMEVTLTLPYLGAPDGNPARDVTIRFTDRRVRTC